jgi:Tfp pilus assembly protein PilP
MRTDIRIRGFGKLRFNTAFIVLFIACLFVFSGCSGEPDQPPAKGGQVRTAKSADRVPAVAPVVPETKKKDEQAGYVYEQRGRRDPFSSLVVIRKNKKKDDSKIGTLEGYDLSEFALGAIANKGRTYFALLISPDNRSFTVEKGTVIGLNRGKVKEITSETLTMVEYVKNYKGELKPRKIMLEFHKGEGK